jgi:hypothetical protein
MEFNLGLLICKVVTFDLLNISLFWVNFLSPRLYLINSPVVRAENLRFKEEGVRDVLKDMMLPWYNAYPFFIQNVFRLHKVCTALGCVSAEL